MKACCLRQTITPRDYTIQYTQSLYGFFFSRSPDSHGAPAHESSFSTSCTLMQQFSDQIILGEGERPASSTWIHPHELGPMPTVFPLVPEHGTQRLPTEYIGVVPVRFPPLFFFPFLPHSKYNYFWLILWVSKYEMQFSLDFSPLEMTTEDLCHLVLKISTGLLDLGNGCLLQTYGCDRLRQLLRVWDVLQLL